MHVCVDGALSQVHANTGFLRSPVPAAGGRPVGGGARTSAAVVRAHHCYCNWCWERRGHCCEVALVCRPCSAPPHTAGRAAQVRASLRMLVIHSSVAGSRIILGLLIPHSSPLVIHPSTQPSFQQVLPTDQRTNLLRNQPTNQPTAATRRKYADLLESSELHGGSGTQGPIPPSPSHASGSFAALKARLSFRSAGSPPPPPASHTGGGARKEKQVVVSSSVALPGTLPLALRPPAARLLLLLTQHEADRLQVSAPVSCVCVLPLPYLWWFKGW
jgi:hypothetical protein